MGVIDIGWGIGAASGPALAGYIFDISGSYTPAFLGGIVAALVAAVLILFLRMPKAIAKEKLSSR
jgi:cyanate permease